MITLLLRVHTTYTWVQFFAHIPFVVKHAFNVTPRSGKKNIHCKFLHKLDFSGEGSTEADDVSFAAIIYITLA